MPKKRKKRDEPNLDFIEDKKKPSPLSKLKNYGKGQKRKVPITFNVGVAIILFFCYLSITFVSLPAAPELLIILIPTLYILVRYIQLERETYDKKYS